MPAPMSSVGWPSLICSRGSIANAGRERGLCGLEFFFFSKMVVLGELLRAAGTFLTGFISPMKISSSCGKDMF